MGNRAKKHHIVPEVLQRQFVIEGDSRRIWRAKRLDNGSFPMAEKKLISKTFVIRDYYTVTENEHRSDIVEKDFYGRIDDFLGRFLPEVITIINAGGVPTFREQTLHDIRTVALDMAKRTPDFLKGHDDLELGKKLVEETLADLQDEAALAYRNKLTAELADEQKLRDRGRNVRVKATLQDSKKVNEALTQFTVRWAISETKHSFILPSMMAFRIGNGGPNGFSNPKMELWMPITPKIALVLVRDPFNKIPMRVVESPQNIRQINEFSIKNSFEVASHSETLLKCLLAK